MASRIQAMKQHLLNELRLWKEDKRTMMEIEDVLLTYQSEAIVSFLEKHGMEVTAIRRRDLV